jgi:hypothetical protein
MVPAGGRLAELGNQRAVAEAVLMGRSNERRRRRRRRQCRKGNQRAAAEAVLMGRTEAGGGGGRFGGVLRSSVEAGECRLNDDLHKLMIDDWRVLLGESECLYSMEWIGDSPYIC